MTPLPYVETTRVGVTRIDWIFERSIARYAFSLRTLFT